MTVSYHHHLLSLNSKQWLLFIFATFLHLCNAEEHYITFNVTEKNFTRACYTKGIIVVNGSYPGPPIRVTKGDTAYINVYNQAPYGITVHWHGVKQPRNPWGDGPEYITQCPILPGTNFTQKVIFTTEEGTLWYHAHSDWTRNSLHGAIVIDPAPGTPYPFDEPDGEETLILGSWYNLDVNENLWNALATGTGVPESDCYVINGQPGDYMNCSQGHTYQWEVEYNKTYLLRLINAAQSSNMFVAIADHNMTVVGLDGNYVKPVTSSYVLIYAGQTMNVLVTTDQTPDRYYIAARRFSSEPPLELAWDNNTATAILQYEGGRSSGEAVFPSQLPWFRDYALADNFTLLLRSLASEEHPVDVPTDVTTRMYITASMNELPFPGPDSDNDVVASSLNNISFSTPTEVDILTAYYKNISGVYEPDFPNFPPNFFNFTADEVDSNYAIPIVGTMVKVLRYNASVEIVFQGTNVLTGAVDHPMHLHGYDFYVVGRGMGNFDPEKHPKTYNLVDPPAANTFAVQRNGWAAIRFVASNPGVWLLHCHVDRHFSWGMGMVFIVENGPTEDTSMLPPPTMPQCKGLNTTAYIKNSGHSGMWQTEDSVVQFN